jgi:small ligand-binding sensory domain FIST
MNVATGLAKSHHADPQIIVNAVAKAIEKIGLSSVNGVLLYLTPELMPHLAVALKRVATLTQCTQIMGCLATGVFTEEDWVLDCPAAAAMVFGGDIHINLANRKNSEMPTLTLLSPSGVFYKPFKPNAIHYGGIAGDVNGQGKYATWQNAKGELTNQVEAYFSGVQSSIGLAHGLTILSPIRQVTKVFNFDLILVGGINAHVDLANTLNTLKLLNTPLHLLSVLYAKDQQSFHQGHFDQTSIISIDALTGYVTLANRLSTDYFICWAVREINPVAIEINSLTKQFCDQHHLSKPAFALLFSSISRGPFSDGIDHDLVQIKKQLPEMPFIGFYGNATIANIYNQNPILSHSIVINLMSEKLLP